ncbi:MAG: hypothetical protein INQ03_12030 [Candidatus Heimdallarchaeota archaeon]|nr:hypothetical protein [Candidatus Heimdallarchaeota archaeon]
MSFFKKLFQKDPKKALESDLQLIEITDRAINLFESLHKHDHNLILEYFNEHPISNGKFIGNKGWYIPEIDDKLEHIWPKFTKGPIDLQKTGESWGLNAKRCYIVLKEEAERRKLDDPYFYRNDNNLYLASYIHTLWVDAIASLDFDEENNFNDVVNTIRIESDFRDKLKTIILEQLKEESSTIVMGSDSILRLKDDLDDLVVNFIEESWDEKKSELSYSDISDRFGLSIKDTEKLLQHLISENLLPTTTNYPVDLILRPRIR